MYFFTPPSSASLVLFLVKINAEQFVAIVAESNRQGIFSDKGIDAIKEANTRLREMTTATADALEGIGISSQEVQQALQDGSATTFDIIRRVSERLNELPDNASVVGTAIADIFGGPGEDAGLKYIRTLKDIGTNLDEVKGKTGELGIGQCTRKFRNFQKGCPPTEEEIYRFLKDYIQEKSQNNCK